MGGIHFYLWLARRAGWWSGNSHKLQYVHTQRSQLMPKTSLRGGGLAATVVCAHTRARRGGGGESACSAHKNTPPPVLLANFEESVRWAGVKSKLWYFFKTIYSFTHTVSYIATKASWQIKKIALSRGGWRVSHSPSSVLSFFPPSSLLSHTRPTTAVLLPQKCRVVLAAVALGGQCCQRL
jgi:hypothetical protein